MWPYRPLHTLDWPCFCSEKDFCRGIASGHDIELGNKKYGRTKLESAPAEVNRKQELGLATLERSLH